MPAATTCVETDTRKSFYFDGTNWINQEFPVYKQFNVFKVGANTFITDTYGKIVQGPTTDTADAINDQLATMGLNSIWKFLFDATSFTIENPIIFPTINATQIKKVVMQGQGFISNRAISGGATNLQPSATFPLNRYVFELNNPGSTTSTTGLVEINNMQCTNSANFTREVGFIKLECGYDVNAIQDGTIVKDIYTQYLWRTLDLSGHVWYSRFENISISSPNVAFIGDTDILLHDGGHVHVTNPTVKSNLFSRLRVSRGDCHMNSAIRIQSGNYNYFRDCFVDGKTYDVAVVDMNNTDTLTTTFNHFDNLQCLDLEGVAPDNRKGTIWMTGQCVDNWFVNCRLQGSSPTNEIIRMEGSGVVRNNIEFDAWWGGTAVITDTGTDGTNVVKVKGGAKFSPTLDVAITHTGGMSRIIDERPGAQRAGATSVADGGTISHGLFTTPLWVRIEPTVASTLHAVTAKSATTFTVSLKTTGGASAATQTVYWEAGVYR